LKLRKNHWKTLLNHPQKVINGTVHQLSEPALKKNIIEREGDRETVHNRKKERERERLEKEKENRRRKKRG
jgi:hypothetical protein